MGASTRMIDPSTMDITKMVRQIVTDPKTSYLPTKTNIIEWDSFWTVFWWFGGLPKKLARREIEILSDFTILEPLKKIRGFSSWLTNMFGMRWGPNRQFLSFRVEEIRGFSQDSENCSARSGFGTVAKKGSTERGHCSEEFLVVNRDQLGPGQKGKVRMFLIVYHGF